MSVSESAHAQRSHLIGIFILSLTGIAFQVVLTRLFSVVLYYHYAFAGISLAMLGLTIGAVKVYLEPERYNASDFENVWAGAAMRHAISSVLTILFFLCTPLWAGNWVNPIMTLGMLAFVVPYIYSGICVTMILTQFEDAGKRYAADLTGAGLGCIAVVLLLSYCDPVTIVLLLAGLSAFAGWHMLPVSQVRARKNMGVLMWLLVIAGTIQGSLYLAGKPHMNVVWAKGKYEMDVLYERWNATSRVRVYPWGDTHQFGWGFAQDPAKTAEEYFLDIDSDAGTILTRFNGDPASVAYLKRDLVNIGYRLRPVDSVVIVGAGGGRDILSALTFNVRDILALELNSTIVDILKNRFADFVGHIAERPEVRLIHAEARSWLARNQPKSDMIQLSFIDTWAAVASGGLALAENRLYTRQAWDGFMHGLKPGGMLTVSRWFMPEDHYVVEFFRLLSLAADTLKAQGVPAAEIKQHIMAFSVRQIVTVVVSRSPFTPQEMARAKDIAQKDGFRIVQSPESNFDDASAQIVSGNATPAFYQTLSQDISSPTDDRPFFFFTMRPADAFSPVTLNFHEAVNNSALTVTLALLAVTCIAALVCVTYPLRKRRCPAPARLAIFGLLYFSAIGAGFMLVEISQLQRLVVFLGHPIYGLTVVLFTLLACGGLGSYTVTHESKGLWKRAFWVCMVLCATGLLTAPVAVWLNGSSIPVRIIVSCLLLAPAGFFMGMMFPVGMRMTSGSPSIRPWLWAANGVMSVFASILGMALSMLYGIAATYWAGLLAYGLCAIIVILNRRRLS